jgi:hypothetical protein
MKAVIAHSPIGRVPGVRSKARLAKMHALPVRVLFAQGDKKKGRLSTDNHPFNVAVFMQARELGAC